MKTKLVKRKIIDNKTRLHELKKLKDSYLNLHCNGYEVPPEIRQGYHDYLDNYTQLVFSYGDAEGENGLYELLKQGNNYAIEYAVCFIEVRPYFFRSGYMYRRLIKKLNQASLNESQQLRYDTIKEKYKALIQEYRKKRGW